MVMNRQDRQRQPIHELINTYHPVLVAFILGKTGDKNVSEDMAQEVWFKFLRGKNEVYNVRAYLFTIAKNLITDHYRTKKVLVDINAITNSHSFSVNGSERKLELEELNKALELFLGKEDYQLYRLENEGYTNEEIAAQMHMKPKTVANRKSLIKKKIKDEWQ